MPKRVPCKFFAHGGCLKGEECKYSHHVKGYSNNICRHYQRGLCYYGDACRFLHVKHSTPTGSSSETCEVSLSPNSTHPADEADPNLSPSSVLTESLVDCPPNAVSLGPTNPLLNSDSLQRKAFDYGSNGFEDGNKTKPIIITVPEPRPLCSSAATGNCSLGGACLYIHGEMCPTCRLYCLHPFRTKEREAHLKACKEKQRHAGPAINKPKSGPEDGTKKKPVIINLPERSLCSEAATGACSLGENCPYIHGDMCPTCKLHCLHPLMPEERDNHLRACKERQRRLEILRISEEIECSVCLDRVLSKPTAAERKFGLLAECDHPFCISCIRNWRSSSTSDQLLNPTSKSCPVCRKISFFVTPSVTWYSTKEEKQDIIDHYKCKLGSIDCKHFNFGNGNCPFGTGCFYKHNVKPGSYFWKHKRPPPRRQQSRRPAFMDAFDDAFDGMVLEDDAEIFFGHEFFDGDEDDPTLGDLAFLFMQLGATGPSDYSSDDDSGYIF